MAKREPDRGYGRGAHASSGDEVPVRGAPASLLRLGVALLAIFLLAILAGGTGCASSGATRGEAPSSNEDEAAEKTAASEAAPPPETTGAREPAPSPGAAAGEEPTPSPEGPARSETSPIDPEMAAELQGVLDRAVADGYSPGAVLAVSVPGRGTWSGASGLASREPPRQMQPDTPYRIASLSKTFTAVVVLQLVQEGRVDLDAPVSAYLPGLLPAGEETTVRQLLGHRSGLYEYLWDPAFQAEIYANPDRAWAPRELVRYTAGFPPQFAPGTPGRWGYSSANFVVLGMIVEEVTGNAHHQEVRRRILDPLGLDGTYLPPDEAVEGALASGYSGAVDQTDVAVSAAWATADVVSTTEDTQRFARALFAGELLEDETLDEMLRFADTGGAFGMPDLAYGLAVMRHRLPVGLAPDGRARPAAASTAVGHIGQFGGFSSALWYIPELDVTIALAVNQSNDPNVLATQALDVVLRDRGR